MITRLSVRRASAACLVDMEIHHESTVNAFKAADAFGGDLGHLEYKWTVKNSKKAIDIYHTYTRPKFQGRGIAGRLVEETLEWAKQNNLVIIPSCTYVAAYVHRHPKWKSLL